MSWSPVHALKSWGRPAAKTKSNPPTTRSRPARCPGSIISSAVFGNPCEVLLGVADAVALDELLDRPGLVALMVDGGFGEVGVAQVADGGGELGGAGGEFLERLGLGEAAVVGVETGVAGVDDLVGKWG